MKLPIQLLLSLVPVATAALAIDDAPNLMDDAQARVDQELDIEILTAVIEDAGALSPVALHNNAGRRPTAVELPPKSAPGWPQKPLTPVSMPKRLSPIRGLGVSANANDIKSARGRSPSPKQPQAASRKKTAKGPAWPPLPKVPKVPKIAKTVQVPGDAKSHNVLGWTTLGSTETSVNKKIPTPRPKRRTTEQLHRQFNVSTTTHAERSKLGTATVLNDTWNKHPEISRSGNEDKGGIFSFNNKVLGMALMAGMMLVMGIVAIVTRFRRKTQANLGRILDGIDEDQDDVDMLLFGDYANGGSEESGKINGTLGAIRGHNEDVGPLGHIV